MSSALLCRAARTRVSCSYRLHGCCARAYTAASAPLLPETSNDAGADQLDLVAGPSSVSLDVYEETSAAKPQKKARKPKGSSGKTKKPKETKKKAEPVEVVPLTRSSRTVLDSDEDEMRLSGMVLPQQAPPTLDDLESFRPKTKIDPDYAKYPLVYNKLTDSLNRAFSKLQLVDLAEMCNLNVAKFTKPEIIETILERQWKLPTLAEVEKRKRDRSEVVARSFLLDAPQLFHILGKNGANLLQISVEFNVHVSVTSNPLALRVEGLLGSMRGVSERIKALLKGIVTESVELPSGEDVPREQLQGLSREANVFITNDGIKKGKVHIHAKNLDGLRAAKRLIIRNDFSGRASHPRPLLCSLTHRPQELGGSTPQFPRSYAMYPSISLQPLPTGVSSTGVFRIRQVGSWLSPDASDDPGDPGSSIAWRDRLWDVHGNPKDMKSSLLERTTRQIAPNEGSTKTITARIGHVLLAPNTPDRSVSLTPPVQGQLPIIRLLEWVAKSHPKTTFMPSVPPSVMSGKTKRGPLKHRLVYRNTRDRDAPSSEASAVLIFEAIIPDPVVVLPSPSASREGDMGAISKEGILPESARIRYGTESSVDLLLPDKRYDLRLSATDLLDTAEDAWPTLLKQYSSELRAYQGNGWEWEVQPEAPIHFRYKDSEFVLESNTNFFESREVGMNNAKTNVLIESVLDLEGKRKTTDCKVQFVAPQSNEDWEDFFAVCDSFTDGNRLADY
ncbi:hypothetical protein OE88DRAFT_1650815 [Heliocybe sulcata]|uniref:Mitochondrial inner-membrane-bound regulator-domain-containing protein n=1 Tax=Heliocybe sulcata TaxID=5364 RepID=A0A5C3NIV2_9AGAM|nr:hypothetical protein OE88DRAFT_1650815 [Heliocybe sulcata]